MNIRNIEPNDWARIFEIQKNTYPKDLLESLDVLKAKATTSPTTCFILEVGDNIAGYLLSLPYELGQFPSLSSTDASPRIESNLHIHDLCIDLKYKNLGYGRKILSDFFSMPTVNNFHTVSVVSVMNSQNFWRKIGFSSLQNIKIQSLSTYGKDSIYLSMQLRQES
jgi:ribosomal protein S18 acetylase RimI-like enzyme